MVFATSVGFAGFEVMRAYRIASSSIIDRVGYDDATRTLCISFHDTGKYLYDDVPPELYAGLCQARSAGSFFNERIKGHFRFRRDPGRKRFGPNAAPPKLR